jgi:hypothetical protein
MGLFQLTQVVQGCRLVKPGGHEAWLQLAGLLEGLSGLR